MIHVTPQPEPDTFDSKVRERGRAWMNKHQTPPPGNKFPPYWRDCLDDLHSSYNGYCAYLAVYFERVGGVSVDHFIAKSRRPDLAYEWSNYRLACSIMNSRKGNHDDILDPFQIETGWFYLELVTGRIYPNKELSPDLKSKVESTIKRLKLDDDRNREMRARHYQEYREETLTDKHLKKYSPFVWLEAKRQGLL